MGQKTNPIGNRIGIIRGWESNWYGGNDYGDKLAEDQKIRKYVHARLAKASISRVIIERTLKIVTITITTARPGIIIGKGFFAFAVPTTLAALLLPDICAIFP